MAMRLARSPLPWESPAPIPPIKVATTSSRSLLYVLLILVAFALISYCRMTSSTVDAPVIAKQDIIQKYELTSSRSLTLWSSDFHISPIADVKHLLKDFGVTVIDKSLSGHCHLMNTCERDLRVINKQNGIDLNPCTNALRKEFYQSYRLDPVMQTFDAFICNHAASMCELFMPFRKPMIVIASTRYEIGRLDAAAWQRWNNNLRLIAASPYNTIAANNRYDQEYIRYFTGIENVLLLPNFCNYVNARYSPTRPEILLGPARGVNPTVQQQMFISLRQFNAKFGGTPDGVPVTSNSDKKVHEKVTIAPIRDLYPHFEYKDLAAHPAIVILPYQVSFMSLFEFYRMQIPLFVPSAKLLATWHREYNMLNERTWMGVFGNPQSSSVLGRYNTVYNNTIPAATNTTYLRTDNTLLDVPHTDPNNEHSYEAVLEWVKFSDFYAWPYIQTFESWDDLFVRLSDTSKLRAVSEQMGAFNLRDEAQIKAKWTHILDKIRTYKDKSSDSSGGGNVLPVDINDSLEQMYGYRLSNTDCSAQMHSKGARPGTNSLRGQNNV